MSENVIMKPMTLYANLKGEQVNHTAGGGGALWQSLCLACDPRFKPIAL